MGNNGFGNISVYGFNLVPLPPAIITTPQFIFSEFFNFKFFNFKFFNFLLVKILIIL